MSAQRLSDMPAPLFSPLMEEIHARIEHRVAEIRAESPRRKATDRAASITGELMTRPQYRYVDGALLADLVRDTLALVREG